MAAPKGSVGSETVVFLWIAVGLGAVMLWWHHRDVTAATTAAQAAAAQNATATAGGPGYVASVPIVAQQTYGPAATIGGTGGYGNSLLAANQASPSVMASQQTGNLPNTE